MRPGDLFRGSFSTGGNTTKSIRRGRGSYSRLTELGKWEFVRVHLRHARLGSIHGSYLTACEVPVSGRRG